MANIRAKLADKGLLKASATSDDATRRTAGYVKSPVQINCGSCLFLENGNQCMKWKFEVDPVEGCCDAWDNEQAKNWRKGRK